MLLFDNVLHLKCGRNDPLSVPETKVAATKGPMKKVLFSDEEKKQLSYLRSMLHQEPTEEEEETQRVLDWFVDNKDKFKDGKLIEPKEDQRGTRMVRAGWKASTGT
jgi:hypothetical protein